MSLSDMIFIFGLVLIIFGPKKLPEISRQIGKMMFEFRRASNEFKMQIDEELRAAEQTERQKQLATQSSTPVAAVGTSSTAAAAPLPAPDPAPSILPPSTGAPVSANPPTHAATLAAMAAERDDAQSSEAELNLAAETERPDRTEYRSLEGGGETRTSATAPDSAEVYQAELRGEEPLHHG